MSCTFRNKEYICFGGVYVFKAKNKSKGVMITKVRIPDIFLEKWTQNLLVQCSMVSHCGVHTCFIYMSSIYFTITRKVERVIKIQLNLLVKQDSTYKKWGKIQANNKKHA